MRQVIEEPLQLVLRQAMPCRDFGIMKNPADLCEDGVRDGQVKVLGPPGGENLCRRAARTEDGTHQDVGIQDDTHHTFRRLALVRTARMASPTSCSIVS